MTTIYLFAGQGSQHVGMGGDLFDRFPDLESQADEILGYSIRELCLQDPHKCLDDTRFTQPALFVVNAMAYRAQGGNGRNPGLALGHSLGEYNALEAAGAFSFADGLRLVTARAEAMSQITGGGMTVVVGLSESNIRFLLLRSGFDEIDVANLNAPRQVVLAGPVHSLEDFERIVKDAGARMARRLQVSGPFHSRYMRPAAERLASALHATPFQPLLFPVIANCTAQPYPDDGIGDLLIKQIDHPVRWVESLEPLVVRAENDFVEIGGTSLMSMVRQIRQAKGER